MEGHDIDFYLLRAKEQWTYSVELEGRHTEVLAVLQQLQRKEIITKYYTN